jgi:hypothetical protein
MVVLVPGPGTDDALDQVANGLDGLALPDAHAEAVIGRGGVDGQGHTGGQAGLERLLLGGFEPLGIVDVVEHGDEHSDDLAVS